ncbi:ubiquitin carboxyl-terminal hydrolase 12-like [Eucalyptus grandis]|uniref:ubiquitin carboxyl-terminal hydrolase 12-like n=1 Tax=Eucalyptus grandis TaxID=71139 RepID=UPI00192EB167|nr:ubiquitin carboxyl-terminal hydrolase 12-like [Eucalyptus grandis]
MQGLKNLKVAFHHASKDEVVIYHVRLPEQSTVGDVINELKTKVDLSRPDAELRLLEIFYHKIYKIFPSSEKIKNINDQYWTLRAEEAMEEQSFHLWKYTWKISNFTNLTQKKYSSEVFTLSDNAWQIRIFPRGNNAEHLSIYLDVADSERLPSRWSRNTNFKLILVDQNNYGNSRIKGTEHNFTARESVCGFASFIPLSKVRDSHNGYLVNKALMVVAEILAPQMQLKILGWLNLWQIFLGRH